jgi:hypothetical protein
MTSHHPNDIRTEFHHAASSNDLSKPNEMISEPNSSTSLQWSNQTHTMSHFTMIRPNPEEGRGLNVS